MRFIDFAYEDFQVMLLIPDEVKYFNRKLSLGAECCEKILKQLLLDLTGTDTSKVHSQKTLLYRLASSNYSKFGELRSYKHIAIELTEIYYSRRYPNKDYYELDSSEYQEIYVNMLKYMHMLLQYLPYEHGIVTLVGNTLK